MGRKLRKMLGTVCAMFAVVLMCGLTVHAKEVTVQNNDIQAALNQAGSSDEIVTVIISPGEYQVNDILKVRSNTIIQAEGATFRLQENLAQQGHPILSISGVHNITIEGGKWISAHGAPIVVEKDSKELILDGVEIETSGECQWGIKIYGGSQITIQNSIFGRCGILTEGAKELTLYHNSIINSIFNGIRMNDTEKCTVKDNEIKNSSTYGLLVVKDNGSVIEENKISGSASSSQRIADEHGEGLVINYGSGTKVIKNEVTNTHSNEKDNGNGIIVSESNGVVLDGNVVSNSGNHGIQVTNHSANITVCNNKISNSGRMGFALSRGARVNLNNNTITDSRVCGMALDGHEERVTMTIEGGTISNTKCADSDANAHIWTDSATGTISGVTLIDSAKMGIVITKNSDVEIKECKVYQNAVKPNTIGITVSASKAALNGNVISGFPLYGIYTNTSDGASTTGGNNTVTLPGTDRFTKNGYHLIAGGSNETCNNLLSVSISATSASGQNYYDEAEAGVIIAGQKYPAATVSGGYFSVSYPSADTSKVAVYVKVVADGNTIILNAPNGTTLESGSSGNTPNADTEQIEAFVRRVYLNVLGREPDPAGFEDWVNALATGRQTGAGVVDGFFFSKELKEKNLSIEDYLELVYLTMMDRHSDPAGKQNWVNVYKQGFSERYILNGFVDSKEFGEICEKYGIVRGELPMLEPRDQNKGVTEFVSRNYTKALRREVIDIEGLNNWCYRIIYEKLNPGETVKGFIESPEFIGKNHSNKEFVEIMYQTFFDRDPDPKGFADWMNRLDNGWSRIQVADGFIGAQEFHELVERFGL